MPRLNGLFAVRLTCTQRQRESEGNMKKNWKEPVKDTRFLCDDGVVRTWSELVENIEEDVYPCCQGDYDTLLWCYGAEPVA